MTLIVDWERILLVKYIHTIGYYTPHYSTHPRILVLRLKHKTHTTWSMPMLTHAYTDTNTDTDAILIFTVLYYIIQYYTSTILVAVLIPY